MDQFETELTEATFVSRVALDTGQAWIRVGPISDAVLVAVIFRTLAAAGINIDVITQTSDPAGLTLAFTLANADCPRAVDALAAISGFGALRHSPIAKLSLEGVGLHAHSDAAAGLFGVLAAEGINIRLISTSARVLAVAIDLAEAERAFARTCAAFEFPDESDE